MSASFASIFLDSAMAVLALVLAFLFWKRGTKQFKLHFVSISLLVFVLAISYMLELFSPDLATKLLWNDVEYVSIVSIPVVYFLIILKYAGREDLLNRRNVLLIWIVPTFSLIMVWTNGYHHLFYQSVALGSDEFQTYVTVKGPAYLLHFLYSLGLVFAAIGLVVVAFIRSPGVQRSQIGLVLLSAVTPTAFIASVGMGAQYPVSTVDGMIISFILSSAVLYLAVFRFGLFYATPLVLNAIAEIMQDGAIMLDQEDRIIYLNPGASRVTQKGKEFPLGKPLGEVFPVILAAISDKVEGSNTIEMIAPDGVPLRLEVRVSPVKNGPKFVGRLVILRDITTLSRSQERLATSNNKLNVLFGVTRHDILNRTSVIRGYGQLLRENKDAPRANDYLDKLIDSTEAIDHIINFTKDYEKVGIVSPEWQIVSRSYQRAKVLCAEQGVTYVLDTGTIEIYADPMLERLFYILLDNSYRHGSKVSRISLTAIRSGEGCLIVYEDNGIGVAEQDKKKIFQKGYGRNSGLGLYLGMQILSITGIGIRETGIPKEGARFEIEVPKGMWRSSEDKDRSLTKRSQ